MELKDLDDEYRSAVNQYIKDEWGGSMIVTKGNLFDSSNLPGFIMIDEDSLIGTVLYQIQNEECEIAVLFSLVKSKGVATGLINAVINKARGAECKRVWLITMNDNTHAIRFYQRRGFSLKAVHINAFEVTKKLKFIDETLLGIDEIPILHEFEFEIII